MPGTSSVSLSFKIPRVHRSIFGLDFSLAEGLDEGWGFSEGLRDVRPAV